MDILWILVPLLALSIPLVAMYLDYKKSKMKLLGRSQENEHQVEEVRQLVNKLKTRIENLEAIAAGEPEELTTGTGRGMEEIEIEESAGSIKDAGNPGSGGRLNNDLNNKQRT